MIIYFADRAMSVLGHATTNLPNGYVIKEDLKTEDVNTGVASFSCYIGFTAENRTELEVMTNAGNYLLRSNGDENEFYTIIDSEIDTERQEIYIYAEDAGLDLINEIADEFEAPESYAAEWYINKYTIDSGFEIGINEIPANTKRKLKWEGQSTVTERLASIATQFGGYEIAFSFALKGLEITHKYINIYKKRGQDNGVQLRLNKEVDKIITSRSVANLATAFICEGGVPDDDDKAITLKGYSYDDGDFYVDTNGKLKSRKAVEKWSRYVWNKEPNKIDGYEGHIVRPYSYNTTSQSELCSHAIAELKKYCDMEVNYEANIKVLPAGVKIGDRVNIIDDAGGLYLSTRLLKLETSITEQKYTATLGEHLIKGSGISQKVADLAAEFAKTALSAARALTIANDAKAEAVAANTQAEAAAEIADEALIYAADADQMASDARAAADDALIAAAAAEAAVGRAEESVAEMDGKVNAASQAAQNAWNLADSVGQMASEAHSAAYSAEEKAQNAFAAADSAGMYAGQATVAAEAAHTSAGEAKTQAQSASETATAAKAESKQALENVASLGTQLETLSNTMAADYAKKTELTETTASLQTSISQNAAQISSHASALLVIDETVNDAKEKAEAAQNTADQAVSDANKASEEAKAAQEDADKAADAAAAAQDEADKANAAAAAAQKAADDADTELQTAKQNLEAVTSRVDVTEEEIAEAQKAVEDAQAAVETAQAKADEAAGAAAEAQSKAAAAESNAANAQTVADAAASKADAAAATANEAKGDASDAKTTAAEAQGIAAAAQAKAEEAAGTAATAKKTADDANALADKAEENAFLANYNVNYVQQGLTEAQKNLEAVKGRVDVTEEEIAAAEEAVKKAQEDVNQAIADAAAADALAAEAKANAANAQTAADNAQAAADAAQAEAEAAKAAADQAQADADALAVRMLAAETAITQTSEAITLLATKDEIATTLGGYYTKTEADAAIQVKADAITQSVSSTYATIENMNAAKAEVVAQAATAQQAANEANAKALAAQTAAAEADAKAAAAQSDLDTAEQNLADVKGRVDATEEDIAAAQEAVIEAKDVADQAVLDAEAAHSLADTANTEAIAAKLAAADAQADANALADRMTIAETKIKETAEAITLLATKTEVAETLEGYYTKTDTEAQIQLKADEITQTVRTNYALKTELNSLQIGGRNLATGTSEEWTEVTRSGNYTPIPHTVNGITGTEHVLSDYGVSSGDRLVFSADIDAANVGTARLAVQTLDANGNLSTSNQGTSVPGWTVRRSTCIFGTADLSLTVRLCVYTPNGNVKYRRLKIEKGAKATDWTPAPEDVDTAIGAAQNAADNAQDAVDALAIRVGTAETNIQQTQEAIALTATKEEVTESLTGYYTKTDTEAQIQLKADEITQTVSSKYATIENMDAAKAEVVAAAAAAQQAAANADAKAVQAALDAKAADERAANAQKDLDTAEQNLADVTSRVGASEGEITAAKAAVVTAQGAADTAKADAATAKQAADDAQAEAEAAREVADAAQDAADALADRMTTAETWITETSEQITMFATKSEVEEVDGKFGNYYTAAQTNAKIQEKANEITLSVSSTYATASSVEDLDSSVRIMNDSVNEAYQTAYQAQTKANEANGSAESAYLAAQAASGKATTAQNTADAANNRAGAAQVTASNAKTAAENAQAEVDAIDARVVQAEAKITAHDNAINLRATKTEVNEALGNYYTKEQTSAEIQLAASGITQSVRETYTTKDELDNLEIGGRNLLPNSEAEITNDADAENANTVRYADLMPVFDKYGLGIYTLSFDIKAAVEGENKANVAVSCGEGAIVSKHTFPSRLISNIAGEYVRHSFTFSPGINNADGTNSMLIFQGSAIPSIKNVKLEKGGKATDWTPAPEDVDEKIGGVSDSLGETNDRVEIAESTIQQLANAIRMLVVDSEGTSLLEQTSTGWTFNLKSTEEQVNNISNGLQDLQTEIGDTKSVVNVLDEAVKDLGVLSEYIKIGTYTYTDDEGVEHTEPSIDLGETDSEYKLRITNTQIMFTDGSANLVEINSKNKSLDIERARIKNELQMGGFVWKIRSNGNLGIVWKGANS